ncbi:MAG TPA: YcaO-like family protein [Spirochaetota bacterium]|nr:YcaO-like family protein [Spirochaetota bacterium]
MSLYNIEAIKVCPPEETVARCLNVMKKFGFEEKGIIQYEFRNQEDFGVWAGNLFINHRILYDLFPEKFPYLKDAYNFWFKKVSGKGVSKTQCTASLFMEMFERISIEFKIYEILQKRIIKKYKEYLEDIRNTLLYPYMEKSLSTKKEDEQVSFIEVKDIVNNSNILFPIKLLFHSSNGYTAGNEDKEAIVHAIFEIVERYTQTLFVIKQTNSTIEDIIAKLSAQIYGYDPSLFNDINNISPFVVSIDSIVKEFPDLEGVINSIGKNFTKFEIVDISYTFNGVKFYSYIVRQGREDTNFKLFASGGCHFDQRIAILRALTEASQGYVPYEKLNQSWNGYIFTRKFIDTVFDSKLPVKNLEKDKRVFNEMDDIYSECIKAFKSILVFNCTNENFNIPVHSVYIPELYSKSFLWSNIFSSSNVGDLNLIKYIGEENLFKIYNFITEKSIGGIESLFFLENHNQLDETIREKLYFLYLSYTNDKDMFDYILNKEENRFFREVIENRTKPEISTVPSIDKIDEESFLYFYNILTKEKKNQDDYLYLIENYIRMGLIDYAVEYANKNNLGIDEIIEESLSLYEELLEYAKFNNMFKRGADISTILYRITKDEDYIKQKEILIQEHISLMERYNKFISKNSNGETTIFGLRVGENIGSFSLHSVYQREDFVYRLLFVNSKNESINVDISLIQKSNFRTYTENGFYIDYNVGFFASDKKKFINEFISFVEKIG